MATFSVEPREEGFSSGDKNFLQKGKDWATDVYIKAPVRAVAGAQRLLFQALAPVNKEISRLEEEKVTLAQEISLFDKLKAEGKITALDRPGLANEIGNLPPEEQPRYIAALQERDEIAAKKRARLEEVQTRLVKIPESPIEQMRLATKEVADAISSELERDYLTYKQSEILAPGLEMGGTSALLFVPAMAAGPAAPFITTGIYSGAFYNETMHDLEKLGLLTDDKATNDALVTALTYGGVELASNVVSLGILKGVKGASESLKAAWGASPNLKHMVKTATARGLRAIGLSTVAEYVEESVAEASQEYIEEKFWQRRADDLGIENPMGEPSSFRENLSKYYAAEKEAGQLFVSVLLFSGLGAKTQIDATFQSSIMDYARDVAKSKLVLDGMSEGAAEARVNKNLRPEFFNNTAFKTWQKALGLDATDIIDLTAKGFDMRDFTRMKPEDVQTVVGEFKSLGESPTYQKIKEFNKQLLEVTDLDRQAEYLAESMDAKAPQWWNDFHAEAGYGTPSTEITFETEKGSTYKYNEGKTVRNKSLHAGHDPKDVGVKKQSEMTLFLDPENAREVGMWNGLQSEGKKILVQGNTVTLLSKNPATGAYGRDGQFTFTTTPEVGKAPLELWEKSNSIQGAWNGNHPGNKIVKLDSGIDQNKHQQELNDLWNVVSAFAHARGQSGKEFFDKNKASLFDGKFNPLLNIPSSPEQLAEIRDRLGEEQLVNFDEEMANAGNLKDSLNIFISTFRNIFPEQVAFLEKMMESPTFTKQLTQKTFGLFSTTSQTKKGMATSGFGDKYRSRIGKVSQRFLAADIARREIVGSAIRLDEWESTGRKELPEGYVEEGDYLVSNLKRNDRIARVLINKDRWGETAVGFATTLLHEIVHVATFSTIEKANDSLDSGKDFRIFLETAYAAVKPFMDKKFPNLFAYEVSNVHEFSVAMVINPLFRRVVLETGKVPPDLLIQKGSELAREFVVEFADGNPVYQTYLAHLGNLLNDAKALYQAEGYHGSGAIFEKPSKEKRLTGEGTMYEGAGFYMVLDEGKGNEEGRARWYAKQYAKLSSKGQALFEEAKKLFPLSNEMGFIGVLSYLEKANESGEAWEIIRDYLGTDKFKVAETLYELWDKDQLASLRARALYRVKFAEGMKRVQSETDRAVEKKLYILENWLKSDLLDEIKKSINFEKGWKRNPPDEMWVQIEELFLDPDNREFFIESGLKAAKSRLEGDDIPPSGLPFGVFTTPQIEKLFSQAIEAQVDRFFKTVVNVAPKKFDKSKLSSEKEGWLFKDSKEYYMLPWREVLPQEIRDAVLSRLKKFPSGPQLHVLRDKNLVSGEEFYRTLESVLGSDHAASEFLDSIGILGTVYQGDGGTNAVAYNEDRVSVSQPELFQDSPEAPKGQVTFDRFGRFRMQFFEAADYSTLLHEWSHVFFENLSKKERNTISKLALAKEGPKDNPWKTFWDEKKKDVAPTRYKDWDKYVEVQEYFARNFERYMQDGIAPSLELRGVFQRSKAALLEIYKGVMGQSINPKLKKIFDQMLTTERQRLGLALTLAEQTGREFLQQKYSNALKAIDFTDGLIAEALSQDKSYEDFVNDMLSLFREDKRWLPDVLTKWEPILLKGSWKSAKNKIQRMVAENQELRHDAAAKRWAATEKNLRKLKPQLDRKIEFNGETYNPAEEIDKLLQGVAIRPTRGDTPAEKRFFKQRKEQYAKFLQAYVGGDADVSLFPAPDVADLSANRINEMVDALDFWATLALGHSIASKEATLEEAKARFQATRDQLAAGSAKGASGFFKKPKTLGDIGRGFLDMQLFPEVMLETIFGAKEGTPLRDVLYTNILRGVEKQTLIQQKLSDFLESKLEGLDLDNRSRYSRGKTALERIFAYVQGANPEIHEITLESGMKISMTKAEILSLYLTTLNENSFEGIIRGGIIMQDGQSSESPILLTAEDLNENIFSKMNDKDHYLASVVREYFEMEWTFLDEAYFEITSQRLEKPDHYFPTHVQHAKKGEDSLMDSSIYNKAFLQAFYRHVRGTTKTHQRSSHHNPYKIGDVFKVIMNSMHDTARYAGLAIPLRDARAVLRDQDRILTNEDGTKTLVKGSRNLIIENYGNHRLKMIEDFINGMEGNMRDVGALTKWADSVRRNVMSALLQANIPSALRQTTAIFAYLPEVEMGVWGRALGSAPWTRAEMEELSPFMRERFQLTGIRDLAETYIEKALQDVFGGDRTFSKGDLRKLHAHIVAMDLWSIGYAFRIAELEMIAAGKGENRQAIKERAEYLVRRTQSSYHAMDRNILQRDPGLFERTLTTFGGAQATYFNLIYQNLHRFKETRDPKILGKLALFMLTSAVTLGTINTMSQFTFGTLPEEPSDVWKNFLASLIDSSFGNILGFQSVLELINQGYSPMDPIWLGQVKRMNHAAKNLLGGDAEVKDIIDLTTTFSSLLGIGAGNVIRNALVPITIGESK